MGQPVADRSATADLDREMAFQGKEWAVQRMGWGVMALAIAAGLAGLLGSGPLAGAAASAGALEVAYPRLARSDAATEVVATVGAEGIRDGAATLWLDRAFVERVEIVGVSPEPESVSAADGRLVYRFAVEPGASRATIRFEVEPEAAGRWEWRAGLEDGPWLSLGGFVFP